MSETFGLSHIAMKVRDLDRAVQFYEQAFGAKTYFRNEHTAQVLGPGPTDVIAFELAPDGAGVAGGLIHFGLRLAAPGALEGLLQRVLDAGGTLKARGDFGDNQPYAFVLDPEGYEIEIWYENTPHHTPHRRITVSASADAPPSPPRISDSAAKVTNLMLGDPKVVRPGT